MTQAFYSAVLQRRIEKLIRFQSTQKRPNDLLLCARWIKKELTKELPRKRVTIKGVKHNGVPSVLAVQGEWKNPDILLNGHFDVVSGQPEQFKPLKKGDKIYGRGAADMKAGVASLMTAYSNVVKQRPDLSIGLMLTGDEEVGGKNGAEFLVNEGWKTKLLVNFDGGYSEEISHAEKGIVRLCIASKGKTGRVQYPWEGKCAFDDIALAYQKLEKMFPGRKKANGEDNWYSTFAVRSVETGPNQNQIVDHAEMCVSVHFIEDISTGEMVERIRNELVGFDVRVEMEMPRVFVDIDNPEIVQFQKIYGKHLGNLPKIRGENGTSDARFFSHLNIPMIITKSFGKNAEQDDEWISLESTVQLTKALEEYLLSK